MGPLLNDKPTPTANLVILQLLHTSTDHSDFLRICWEQLNSKQKMQIFHFLYLAKQDKTFVNVLRQELLRNEPTIPWTQLLALFKKYQKLSPQILNSLGLNENEIVEYMSFCIDTPEMLQLWNQKKKLVTQAYEDQRSQLLKELEFAKNQGLKEKRIEALNQLKKIFPNDKSIESVFQAEREFHARLTYNKLLSKRDKKMYIKKETHLFTKEDEVVIFKTIKKYLKKNADYVYDFSVMFMEMDLPLLGLKVIDLMKKKSNRLIWQELHLCLEGRQYARALSLVTQIQRGKLDTEHSFSLLYYQALALHGLGHRSEAIKIIKSILKIRPQFKSASSLLLEWESDS
jgi:tetratricopeptide (TPR) repeat protein